MYFAKGGIVRKQNHQQASDKASHFLPLTNNVVNPLVLSCSLKDPGIHRPTSSPRDPKPPQNHRQPS